MTSRKLSILAIVAVIAVLAGLWLAGRQTSPPSTESAALYPDLKAELASITAVRIVKAGGAISNHHGVGKFRADLLEKKLTPPSDALIRSMKSVLDPSNVFGAANGVFAPKH